MEDNKRGVCMRCDKWHMIMVRAIDQSNGNKGYMCLKCIVEGGSV